MRATTSALLVFSLSMSALLLARESLAQETIQVSFATQRWNQQGHLCFYDQDLSDGLNQNNRNVVVVWLEDAATGDYVRTIHRWGQTYIYNLDDWSVASKMAIDSVTQASERCYSGETCGSGSNRVTAAARLDTGPIDVSDLPDGSYRLRMEISSCEVADEYRGGGASYDAPDATFTFTKGRTSQANVQLGNAMPFNAIRLDYVVGAGNSPPGVWAGKDQFITPTGMDATATLAAVTTDDTGSPTLLWTVVAVEPAGGSASFVSASSASTDVSFTTSGIYTLRLTATDSQGASSSDDVVVHVNVRMLSANADAEVSSGNVNRTYGVLVTNPPASYNAGAWVYMWGPNDVAPCNASNANRSRGYFRFDISTVNGTIDLARLQLPIASQRRETTKWHDFYIVQDADDDWVGGNPDDELSVSWNNQPVNGGDEGTLTGQLVGSYQHRLDYNTWAEMDLDLATIASFDFNDTWTIFGAPRQRCNGMGIAARENAIEPQLLIVEHWQGGMNAPPIADAGRDQSLVDADGNGTASVTLDGSGSTDDIAIITYEWIEAGQTLATTRSVTRNFDLGVHAVDLTVTDGAQASSTDSLVVLVDDRFSPNGTQMEAKPIDGDPTGKVHGELFVHTEGATGGDWFSLELLGGGDLAIDAQPETGTLRLTLYASDGTTVIDSGSGTSAFGVAQTGLAPDTYILHAEAAGGASNASTYALTVTVGGNVLGVAFNPDQATESAGVLGGAGVVTIPAMGSGDVTIQLSVSDPTRLRLATPAVTIPAGQTQTSFDVEVLDNALVDGNIDVVVRASATAYNSGSATFLVIDDDGAGPSLSWSESAMSLGEARSPLVVFSLRLSEASAEAVVAQFSVGGSATPGVDFDDAQLRTKEITIAAGTTETQVFFSLVDDDIDEPNETLTLTLGNATGAVIAAPSVFTLTIEDDDEPTVDTNDPKKTDDDTRVTGGGCVCVERPRAPTSLSLVLLGALIGLCRRRLVRPSR